MTDKILRADSTAITNIRSVTWKEQSNNADNLRFGCCAASSIEFDVFGAESAAPSVGEQLTYIHVAPDTTETTIGIFNAQPAIPSKNTFHVIAYDNIIKLETDFSAALDSLQSSFPMTLATLVGHVCTTAGVTLKSSAFPMASTQIEKWSATGVSCRDVMSWAAEIAGCFVRCDNAGKIEFAQYATRSGYKVYKTSGSSGGVTYIPYKQDGLTYSNYNVSAVDLVSVIPPQEEDVTYLYPSGASGNTYTLNNNLLLTDAQSTVFTAVATNVYNTLSGLSSYRAAEMHLFRDGNPLRAGDIIAVEDAQGVTFNTIVMSLTCSPSGITVTCTAQETYDADRGSSVSKQLINLANNIVRINKLKVDWADIDTAIINYLTANDVTAQNLTIVDANDNVLATFNASGITLGESGNTHAELDYNSFQLIDADGNVYFHVGDLRDENGEFATTDTKRTAFSPANTVSVRFPISELVSVKINGVDIPGCTFNGTTVTLPSDYPNTTVVVSYKTTTAVYGYTNGTRKSGETLGAYSFVAGKDQTASNDYSSVLGGLNNTASGMWSTVVGGEYNSATGLYSTALGSGSIASGANQFVFGTCNIADSSSLEIVGNGTEDADRHNARTLDRNGNETLAGTLFINGANNAFFYESGDDYSFSFNNIIPFGGYLSSDRTVAQVMIYTPKDMSQVSSVSVSALTGTIYTAGGTSLDSRSGAYDWLSNNSYTITADRVNSHLVKLYVTKSSAFSGASSGGAIVFNFRSLTLSFS